MRKLLVLQHVAAEPLGHLDRLLRDSGCRIRYVNFGRDPRAEPDPRRYDGLVVLGGPMNVGDDERYPHLRTETGILRGAVQAGARVAVVLSQRAKRSVARTSRSVLPGSKAECPASGTTWNSASGQARCRSQADCIGQTTS